MLEPHERHAILRLIQSDRPSDRQSFQTAVLYAAQVALSAGLLMAGYRFSGSPAGLWAVVSAALVIQPVMEQVIAASAIRIAANIVGGIVGILIGQFWGDGIWQILLALVVVVFICDLLKLDLGLRTACVSVAVIMMKGEGREISTSRERLLAVVIGCVVAIMVQILAKWVTKRLGWYGPELSSLNAPPRVDPSGPHNTNHANG